MAVEKTLSTLQRVIRLGEESHDPPRRFRRLFDDIDRDGLSLTDEEERLRLRAVDEVQADQRLEHLDEHEADREVWRLVSEAFVDREQDHVPWFVETHARKPVTTTCFFPLEHLVIKRPMEVGDVRLLPVDDSEVPAGRFVSFPPPSEGIMAARVEGTSPARMKERAVDQVTHALRLLRVGMREDVQIRDEQLRFRIGHEYAFKDGGEGWALPADHAIEAVLDERTLDLVTRQPLAGIAATATSRLDKHVLIALDWLDRARLATDQVVRTLFNFFALESLLGDRAEGEKGLAITFRRTMLSLAVEGHFSNPHAIYFLYDHVRSGAVHGEAQVEIDVREHRIFDWNARRALNEFLLFAEQGGFRRRAEVRRALANHLRAPEVLEWLRSRDERWEGFHIG
jgi:hypothetical protein